jgi:hypothetical protein
MERFYNNNSDDEDKEESYFGDDVYDDEEIEQISYIDHQGILNVMQMDMAQSELNQHLLEKAITIAKSGWFWGFKSTLDRLNEIEMIYKKLFSITVDERDSETNSINESDQFT